MVLTVTLTAGLVVDEGKAGVRKLLLAAIGCNVAWGIIDAVLYLMNSLTVRSGKMRLIEAVQRAPDSQTALDLVRGEIEPELKELLDPLNAEALNRSILKHITQAQITKTRLTKDDLYGAVACFWLVFLACLPAALPFVIFSQPLFALRVSNFLLIAILFFVGQKWAQYAGTNRWVAGLVLIAIGLALVGVAILLGG